MLHSMNLSILRQENEDLPIDKSKENEDGFAPADSGAPGITDKIWSDFA